LTVILQFGAEFTAFQVQTCHSAHGMGSEMATISGERMVNFDTNVVAPNGKMPISYRRASDSCTLTCHGHPHATSVADPTAGPVRSLLK
jgi:hypothetical protein